MNANLLREGWKIGKRIESGGYLGCKFTVAESLGRESVTPVEIKRHHYHPAGGLAFLPKRSRILQRA
jgi:hypothetical protein